jgi:hypothetical protein
MMLEIFARAASIILGAGFALAAVWGPGLRVSILIAAIALVLRGTCPDGWLRSLWLLGLFLIGAICLLAHLAWAIHRGGDPLEISLQTLVILAGVLLLAHVLLREGKGWWARIGVP